MPVPSVRFNDLKPIIVDNTPKALSAIKPLQSIYGPNAFSMTNCGKKLHLYPFSTDVQRDVLGRLSVAGLETYNPNLAPKKLTFGAPSVRVNSKATKVNSDGPIIIDGNNPKLLGIVETFKSMYGRPNVFQAIPYGDKVYISSFRPDVTRDLLVRLQEAGWKNIDSLQASSNYSFGRVGRTFSRSMY